MIFTEQLYFSVLCWRPLFLLLLGTLWFNLKFKADTFNTIRRCLLKSVLQNADCVRATSGRVLWSIAFEMLHIVFLRDFNVLALHTLSALRSLSKGSLYKLQISWPGGLFCVGNTY